MVAAMQCPEPLSTLNLLACLIMPFRDKAAEVDFPAVYKSEGNASGKIIGVISFMVEFSPHILEIFLDGFFSSNVKLVE